MDIISVAAKAVFCPRKITVNRFGNRGLAATYSLGKEPALLNFGLALLINFEG